MLRAKKTRSYRSKNGNTVFTYEVSGTTEELEQFKSVQGDYYREDDESGKPLWFSTNFVGEKADLIITRSGKVIADMSKFDQAHSLAAQYGGNFGQALANEAAKNIMGSRNEEEGDEE